MSKNMAIQIGELQQQNKNGHADYETMTIEKRIEKIRSLRIHHPRFQQALDIIKRCHQSPNSAVGLQCAFIEGKSGVGKSALIEEYLGQNPSVQYGETTTKRTILKAEIQSPVTITTFMEDILEQLGDYNPLSGTRGNKNQRLIRYIKDCGVELILLDEFQHFVHRDNQKINSLVADHFKSLINRVQVPVVIFGIEDEVKRIIESNVQLRSRFSIRYNLSPFGKETKQRKQEFKNLLHIIDTHMPFVELSQLDDTDISAPLLQATNGVMRPLMRIIREAAELAVNDRSLKIEKKHLAHALQIHNCIAEGKEYFKEE